MRPLHWNIAGTVIVGVGFTLLAGAADTPKPTEPIKLNVKLGLWEIATQANISGMPPLSDDMLSKLTPDQRARMQAAMQASMADAAKPKLAKHCVTAEKVARGLDMDRHDSSNCQKKIATNTASELELNESCAGADGTMVLSEHIQLSGSLLGGSEQMTGSVHFVKTAAGKAMTVDSTIKGQWLDASCGDIKDFQLEK
jgi:hypothetical protein